MPYPTPFHPRTSALCASYQWKEWAGYHSVRSYDTRPEHEYAALRYAAGLTDVTPLHKYDVTGPNAARFLSRIMVRDIRRLKPGEAVYTCWCDDEGKVLDEGTVTCLEEERFRVTAFAPSFYWFDRQVTGFKVRIEDVSRKICTLALQGPQSREILRQVSDADIDSLRYFRTAPAKIDGMEAGITRTGFTGDLGYEIWTDNSNALRLWDALMAAGRSYDLMPAGLDAVDITRIEAGLLLIDVDYRSARDCLNEDSKSTPFEIGMGRGVQLNRGPFIGQRALRREKEEGPRRVSVGLEIDWDGLERVYGHFGLPVDLPKRPWNTPVPVYLDGEQVGHATSGAWSPILNKNLALAIVRADCAETGAALEIEATVQFQRHTVKAAIVDKPFFRSKAKRS